jgi:RNA-directed DNA polymerase
VHSKELFIAPRSRLLAFDFHVLANPGVRGGATADAEVPRIQLTAGPEIKRAIAPKALDGLKQRIREITRKAKGVSMEKTIEELASYMRGWRGYFGFCETPVMLEYLTRWVRLRLRAALWRQWKTPRRRRAALLALGVRPRLASHTAGSGRGPWYLAKAKALSVGLSNAYFKSLGLPTLIDGC